MRADIALLISTLGGIAIVGLIVRNHKGSVGAIQAGFQGASQLFGVAETGNVAFINEAKGYAG